MSFVLKGKRCDLMILAEEFGELPDAGLCKYDLIGLIKRNKYFNEEEFQHCLQDIIAERLKKEENEKKEREKEKEREYEIQLMRAKFAHEENLARLRWSSSRKRKMELNNEAVVRKSEELEARETIPGSNATEETSKDVQNQTLAEGSKNSMEVGQTSESSPNKGQRGDETHYGDSCEKRTQNAEEAMTHGRGEIAKILEDERGSFHPPENQKTGENVNSVSEEKNYEEFSNTSLDVSTEVPSLAKEVLPVEVAVHEKDDFVNLENLKIEVNQDGRAEEKDELSDGEDEYITDGINQAGVTEFARNGYKDGQQEDFKKCAQEAMSMKEIMTGKEQQCDYKEHFQCTGENNS